MRLQSKPSNGEQPKNSWHSDPRKHRSQKINLRSNKYVRRRLQQKTGPNLKPKSWLVFFYHNFGKQNQRTTIFLVGHVFALFQVSLKVFIVNPYIVTTYKGEPCKIFVTRPNQVQITYNFKINIIF